MSWTVQELIDELQKVEDKTKKVATEGCDCWGDVGSIHDYNVDTILLERSDDNE